MKEEQVFHQALEQRADRRASFLDAACSGDAELRERVEVLLRAHANPGSFLESPARGITATATQPITEKAGTQIGPYRLLQEIGHGGMGVVYMAEQSEPVERRVALKIIKPGMDTRQVIGRFEAERQALAMMDHPNIAKVLDAGATESGRPYFVMELVKGVPITQYCDEHHLTPRQRLELFIPVCQAVQHAHQKGIIHRDIKPSNVMVCLYDGKPVPKVIDFGVAKAISQRLTEKTVFTRFGQIVGTLEYMSPEQAELSQLDVDTRSDIYSLGVLLYELLTGTTPFDKERIREAAHVELLRIIREEEPLKPSARISTLGDTASTVSAHRKTDPQHLSQFLRGELDWIVMKALEKDRTRRYETASGFAADVQRYLDDEPVEACPPSTVYRFKKFVRRNKATLAPAALVAGALLMGLVGTTSQWIRANAQRDVAKLERDDADASKQVAEESLKRAVKAEADARHRLASSYADRALALCEQGEIGRGMLWLARSLRATPDDATDLERVIRTNLAAWRSELHGLSMVVQHDSPVRAVALSPDGSRILTWTDDGTLTLWDAATGRPIGRPQQNQGAARKTIFSPDGSRILTAASDGVVQLWDGLSLKPLGEPLERALEARDAAFNPDGSRVVTAARRLRAGEPADGKKVWTPRVFDVTTREPVGEPVEYPADTSGLPCVAFGAKGVRVLVWLRGGGIQLFDGDRGEPMGPVVGPEGGTGCLAISPDGSRFARVTFTEWLAVLDGATGRPPVRSAPGISPGATVRSLAFSPDGSRLVSGGADGAARLWDLTTWEPIGLAMRHRGTVSAVSFSPDGSQILTGAEDGTARLWKLASDRSLGQVVQDQIAARAAAFGPDGLRVLTKTDGVLQLKNADTDEAVGEPIEQEQPDAGAMVFSPDGSRFVILRGSAGYLHDLASGQPVGKRLPGILGTTAFSPDGDAAFSPDGSRVLTSSPEGLAQLWDAVTLKPIGPPLKHPHNVHSVAFSPDGSRMITACFDGSVRFWDAATLKPVGEPLTRPSEVTWVTYSPDGTRVLAGYADWTVWLWDVATGKPTGPPLHHDNIVCGLAFSPDGSRLLTCERGPTVRLWDAATLKPIGPPLEGPSWWSRASFSPDGSRFLVAAHHGLGARLWEAPPGPLKGDRERIVTWAQVVAGLELDENGQIGVLDGPGWQALHRRLQELGGPPTSSALPPPVAKPQTDLSRSMELALGGYDRAQRGRWDEAIRDFDRAIELSGQSPTLGTQIALWCRALATTQTSLGHEEHAQKVSRYATKLTEELSFEVPMDLLLGDQATRVPLAEINSPDPDYCHWLSPDGLTIYWTREGGKTDVPGGIWTARRKDPHSPFEDPRFLCQGRHPTVTADQLEIALVIDRQLCVARRPSPDQPFSEPQPIEEFRSQRNAKCAAFFRDDLAIVFQADGLPRIRYSTRSSREARWSTPAGLPLQPHPSLMPSSWPGVSCDGLKLWFNVGGRTQNIVLGSRTDANSPFGNYQVVHFDGQPLIGRAPRYVESTNELFYATRPDAEGNAWDLWVIKNVFPEEDEGTSQPTNGQ